MIDREKVIKGLECCTDYCDEETGCPYYGDGEAFECEERLRKDAIALLKAQTARVMTLSEMNEKRGRGEAVYYEDRDATYKSQDVFVVVLDKDLDVVWLKAETYTLAAKMSTMGKTWRCWTRMPTRAQREAEA